MKTTILYGGAFNPPTLAHSLVLQACIAEARRRDADVWLMPSGNRTDKTIGIDRAMRLMLLEAMVADIDTDGVTVQVMTLELDRPVAIETTETADELSRQYPDREILWVFGTDSVATMREWDNGEWLLTTLPKLIIERPGSPIDPVAGAYSILHVETPAISSTEVRRRLVAGESIDGLVPPSVATIVTATLLY